jgi:hypothetical protein
MIQLKIPGAALRTSLAIAALFAVGCGGAPEPAAEAVDQMSGIPNVRAEEIWRSSSERLLSGIMDLVVDSRGRVYLNDRDAGILLLSASGDSLRVIGRKGAGLGEYAYAVWLEIIDGDSLMVFDAPNRRLSVFEPDSGAFAYAHTFRDLPGNYFPGQIARVPAEPSYVAVFEPHFDWETRQRDSLGVVRHLDEIGRIVHDSILVFPAEKKLIATEESDGRVRSIHTGTHPFAPQPIIRISHGLIYYGSSGSPTIDIYDLTGNRIGGFSLPMSPVPITDDDVENWVGSMRGREPPAAGPEFARAREQWIDQLREDVPDVWPLYRTFLVDDAGRIWFLGLERNNVPEENRAWLVYSADGRPLAKVSFPHFVITAISKDRAYSTIYDSLGVPTVVADQIPELVP